MKAFQLTPVSVLIAVFLNLPVSGRDPRTNFFTSELDEILNRALPGTTQGTNDAYVTYDRGSRVATSGSVGIEPHDWEEARRTRECQPADQFPEGNWGQSKLGFQLSLRLAQKVFRNGEPVTAILLVRNVTNTVLDYHGLVGNPLGGPIRFRILTETGNLLQGGEYAPGVLSASSFSPPIYPFTQHKYEENLRRGYELTNGVYKVRAFIDVRTGGEKLIRGRTAYETVELDSAELELRIGN